MVRGQRYLQLALADLIRADTSLCRHSISQMRLAIYP
jgi:hypothetical protein